MFLDSLEGENKFGKCNGCREKPEDGGSEGGCKALYGGERLKKGLQCLKVLIGRLDFCREESRNARPSSNVTKVDGIVNKSQVERSWGKSDAGIFFFLFNIFIGPDAGI